MWRFTPKTELVLRLKFPNTTQKKQDILAAAAAPSPLQQMVPERVLVVYTAQPAADPKAVDWPVLAAPPWSFWRFTPKAELVLHHPSPYAIQHQEDVPAAAAPPSPMQQMAPEKALVIHHTPPPAAEPVEEDWPVLVDSPWCSWRLTRTTEPAFRQPSSHAIERKEMADETHSESFPTVLLTPFTKKEDVSTDAGPESALSRWTPGTDLVLHHARPAC